ncbi:pep-cterm sorting domain-containing protein [Anaeramoeba ignava]|uniref:Pep-cterm sorting domain-containing protein n=1 Tax=Anaeramoeba ignava TaxID=1746090 RepID=A0A9Q0RCJ9_ANAIG|nr:pep-cterm sorting domain-containing protein [Anaeramoeba ignava]
MENYLNLEKLSNDLKNLFQNQNQNEKEEESYFDFEIICEQNQISFKTHKSILSSRSEYFESLFNSKMKEYQENKLILKDVSKNAIEILIFSSKYLIDELIEFSSKFIKNNLQIETIVDVLKLSETMNFNQLFDFSYQFILENFNEFIKTSFFLELEENHLNSILSNDDILTNEFELFQSIIKWGKHKSNINQEKELNKEEKEKFQNQISNIIDKIRFIDFSKQELKDILKQDLIPKQISQKLIQFQKLQNDENEKELIQFIEKQNLFIFNPRMKLNSSEIIEEKEYMKKLKEWINDNDFFSRMKLGFSTKRDGFSPQNWHKAVDDKGKTLVIIKTKDNFIFGGFTQVGWTNDKSKWSFDSGTGWGRIKDSNAFIFSLRNDKRDRKSEKFMIQTGKEDLALHYYPDLGPAFGANDCDWNLYHNLQPGYSNFGSRYNLHNGITFNTNEAKSYLAGSYDKWVVDELETFFI